MLLRDARAEAKGRCADHRVRRAALADDLVKARNVGRDHSLHDALEALGGMPEPRIGKRCLGLLRGAQADEAEAGTANRVGEEFVGDDGRMMAALL